MGGIDGTDVCRAMGRWSVDATVSIDFLNTLTDFKGRR